MSSRAAAANDQSVVRAVATRCFGRAIHAERLPSTNNLVFRLRLGSDPRHDRILKLARSGERHPALVREPQVLALLRSNGIPVPHVEADDLGGRIAGRAWFLMNSAGERTASDLGGLSPHNRRKLFEATGELLARIHAIPFDRPAEFDGRDVVPPRFHRTPLETWHKQCLRKAASLGLVGSADADRLLRQLEELPAPESYSLCHGDFNPSQCIRSGPLITAIVDWEGTYIGDSRYDYAVYDALLDVVAPPDLAERARLAYHRRHPIAEEFAEQFRPFRRAHLAALMLSYHKARRDGSFRAARTAFLRLAHPTATRLPAPTPRADVA